MEEKTLECWEKFEEISLGMICDARKQRGKLGSCMDYPLFRGVRDSKRPLESSLDSLGKAATLSAYHRVIKIAHKHVETVTGKKWNLHTKTHLPGFDVHAYEFMAHLRQNGFPSPLLDWTKSPYIAAFFAFRDIYCREVDEKYVSIFVYREYRGRGTACLTAKPHICRFGPTISTSRTHYLQQSEYSICVREGPKGEVHFAKYEDVKGEKGQDVLIRYNIPMSEQEKVLRELDLMNITAYSLFGSEPSLMDTLAIRELVLEMS